MNIPRDILWKIWNKIPLNRLGKNEFPENYWKIRALDLYGIENLHSKYISTYEKYLQIAGFEGEVTKGSALHVPNNKCALSACKSGDLKLLQYFIQNPLNGKYFIFGESINFYALFQTGNEECIIECLNEIPYILEMPYTKMLSKEKYYKIFENSNIRKKLFNELYEGASKSINDVLNFDDRVIGICMPIKYIKEFLREFRIPLIITAAASSMDIDRYKKVCEIAGENLDYLPYMLDEGDPDQLSFSDMIFFGCSRLLSKVKTPNEWGDTNIDYMPELPRERIKATIKVLRALQENLTEEKYKIQCYLGRKYWSLILYGRENTEGKPSKKSVNTVMLKKAYIRFVEKYIYSSGNLKLIANYLKYSGDVNDKIDLINFPELSDIVEKNIMKSTRDDKSIFYRMLGNYFSPSLYLACYNKIDTFSKIFYLPDTEVAKSLSKSLNKLEPYNPKNPIIPTFLEPKIYWEREILK